MPAVDVLDSLGPSFGNSICLKSPEGDMYIAAVRDRKPKVVIADCSVTVLSSNVITRFIDGQKQTMRRAVVFNEYEQNKGKVTSYVISFMS